MIGNVYDSEAVKILPACTLIASLACQWSCNVRGSLWFWMEAVMQGEGGEGGGVINSAAVVKRC